MRWIASTLRSDDAITIFINIKESVSKIASVLKYVKDQEILANASKILRLICKIESNIEIIKSDCKDLPNIFVDAIQKFGFSLIVIQEIVLALKYYTQVVDAIPNLRLDNLKLLYDLYKESKNDKIRNNIQTILAQWAKILEYEDYINRIGATHLIS